MTTYHLPEGMTAELRGIIRGLRATDPIEDVLDRLETWADAIDPPKPEPVVTDEMVEAVRDEAASFVASAATKRLLEAAVECGWTPPNLESDDDNPSFEVERLREWKESAKTVLAEWERVYANWGDPGCEGPYKAMSVLAMVGRMSERLVMAEGLLRRAISEDRYHGNLWRETTSAEFLYLRSLDGEGDSDE